MIIGMVGDGVVRGICGVLPDSFKPRKTVGFLPRTPRTEKSAHQLNFRAEQIVKDPARDRARWSPRQLPKSNKIWKIKFQKQIRNLAHPRIKIWAVVEIFRESLATLARSCTAQILFEVRSTF